MNKRLATTSTSGPHREEIKNIFACPQTRPGGRPSSVTAAAGQAVLAGKKKTFCSSQSGRPSSIAAGQAVRAGKKKTFLLGAPPRPATGGGRTRLPKIEVNIVNKLFKLFK